MKKLLLVLLVVALASFLLTGCFGVPDGTEGEGEGDGAVTEVTVVISDSVVLDGKTYVKAGTHDMTVTFPAPAVGTVSAVIGYCSGDYSKAIDIEDLLLLEGAAVVLFPNADKTVWTGSAEFEEGDYDCCASYVMVNSGACEDEVCIKFPVIVDADKPYALIEVTSDDCTCGDCELTFETYVDPLECADDVECCGDDCSGLASWSIAVYEEDPFDVCCETPCEPEISTCSGSACPIECTTDCLEVGDNGTTYYVVVNLIDNVGNEQEYYATVALDTACGITVTEYYADDIGYNDCLCTDWEFVKATDGFIGDCADYDNCYEGD